MTQENPKGLEISRGGVLRLLGLIAGSTAIFVLFDQAFDINYRLTNKKRKPWPKSESEPFKLNDSLFALSHSQENKPEFIAFEPNGTAHIGNRLREILQTVVSDLFVPDASDAEFDLEHESHRTITGKETRKWIKYGPHTAGKEKLAIYQHVLSNPNIPWKIHHIKFDEHTKEIMLLITIDAANLHSRPLMIMIDADELAKSLNPEEMLKNPETAKILGILASLEGTLPMTDTDQNRLVRVATTEPFVWGYRVDIGQIESDQPTPIANQTELVVTDIEQRNGESWALARISRSQPLAVQGQIPEGQYFWIKLTDLVVSAKTPNATRYNPLIENNN